MVFSQAHGSAAALCIHQSGVNFLIWLKIVFVTFIRDTRMNNWGLS
jgi:hypothetical protein